MRDGTRMTRIRYAKARIYTDFFPFLLIAFFVRLSEVEVTQSDSANRTSTSLSLTRLGYNKLWVTSGAFSKHQQRHSIENLLLAIKLNNEKVNQRFH